jgi:hypothetical protein
MEHEGCYGCGCLARRLADVQATVEALQQDRDALKIGLNALRDAYDELESRHNDTTATLDATTPAVCPDCDGDGAVDSGGTDPNGNPLTRRCGCREKGGDGE